MNLNLNRYWIFLFFLIFAVVTFFIGRFITGVFLDRLELSGIDQIIKSMTFSVRFLEIYFVFLTITSLSSYYISKRKNNIEISKGFLIAFVFSIVIFAMFLMMLFG